MTELDTEQSEQEIPEWDDGMVRRTFAVDLSVAKGRTVDVRIVPYGEVGMANDGLGGVRRGVIYKEEWMPGVFNHQLNAANRVLVNVEHEVGIGGIVGHGLALREASDGFHGSVKLHDNHDGDKALLLVNEGVLDGVSLEARPVRSVRSALGIVQRVKANLKAIALCREGAFMNAKVLAVREAPIFDEDQLVKPMDPELVERCRRLGIKFA